MKSLLSNIFSKKKKLSIEFCQNNLDRFLNKGTQASLGHLLRDQAIQYKEFECLSHCKECKQSPYAILNGEMLTADSMESLIKQVENKM
ncbi:hypothetical protein CVD28_10080 [Bacillus sp. M6-12]|uniref:DUF1450 domain-containing protein n=1 Tax=Bacillus sp. M6-12 TaxID=2054166 RepID=UPI000C75F887|nr:DUF1450 domain-containing protein [Bacillus sp. M6-12]PLS18018.1 hypothetical protein CVD28_10080 [Bacillus sp. M6-12]